MAIQRVCDFCGRVVKGRAIIKKGKRKFSVIIRARKAGMGSWTTLDVCQACTKKVKWE